jgi:hypothetical protein
MSIIVNHRDLPCLYELFMIKALMKIVIPVKCSGVHLLLGKDMKLMNRVQAFLDVEVMLIDKAPNFFVIAPLHELPHKPVRVNKIITMAFLPLFQK